MNTQAIAFIQGIGGPELLIILVIILLLFGAKKLPELAKGLGASMREFKKAANDVQEDFQQAMEASGSKKAVSGQPVSSGPLQTTEPKADAEAKPQP